MEDLKTIKNVLEKFSKLDYETNSSFVDLDGSGEFVFSATKEYTKIDFSVYGSIVKRLTLLPHDTIRRLTTIHLYFEPNEDILSKLIEDIGNYHFGGSWGFEPDIEPKIYCWNHQEFQLDLRRNRKFYSINHLFLYEADVVSISPVHQ